MLPSSVFHTLHSVLPTLHLSPLIDLKWKDPDIQDPQHSISFSGMNITAGSFSLLGSVVPEDAGVVKHLWAAGTIILGRPMLLVMTAMLSII